MRRTLCAAGLLLLAASIANAQGPVNTVALIDVKAVFQNHARFQAALEDMKNDVRAYEASLSSKQKDAAVLNEKMRNLKAGSPEYKQIEGQLVEITTQAQVGMALKRKEFLDREAKIYFHAYMEVADHVRDHALRNNITIVLSYNGEKIDPVNRSSIFEGVNRAIVYHQVADITPVIIDRLNRGTPKAPIGANPQIPVQKRR